MELPGTDRIEDMPGSETPEDVAVLYSWANLHGAKYRDFSASRREYRAQLRHRAAELAREQELRAQAEAETAASQADAAEREAKLAAQTHADREAAMARQQSLREAEEAARIAAAERMEASRRADAAASAAAIARREEREIAEARASAARQAARYSESEVRAREQAGRQPRAPLPGRISDPYTPAATPVDTIQAATSGSLERPAAPSVSRASFTHRAPAVSTAIAPQPVTSQVPSMAERVPPPPPPQPVEPARRPQGYRPDDASGVREIYRGPGSPGYRDEKTEAAPRQLIPVRTKPRPDLTEQADASPAAEWNVPEPLPPAPPSRSQTTVAAPGATSGPIPGQPYGRRQADQKPWTEPAVNPTARPAAMGYPVPPPRSAPPQQREYAALRDSDAARDAGRQSDEYESGSYVVESLARQEPATARSPAPPPGRPTPPEPRRERRGEPDYSFLTSSKIGEGARRAAAADLAPPTSPESTGPAWLYATQEPTFTQPAGRPQPEPVPLSQSSVADTLQHSRERVAARWYALKGVFEQPGQERPEPQPVRQKETRTPVLAVFSLAGGVGKTSLVATLGRSLSSLGEKVLLTDTTSHGLLPFYFGASELRHGTVRTFSPPSGSTDAPIYLVSYDVEQKTRDEETEESLVEEITHNSRGTHRVLLDLTPNTGWIARRMARLSPTILVPVAPDMNSVISLQAVEKFFHGVIDADGRPLQPFYILNQFDTSLPLHLDVREVLRRQLGDHLLPFVIRRAPAVSEALAEGMTIVDYAPDAPVADDYLSVATWLRTVSAPATAGFRNVRWSER